MTTGTETVSEEAIELQMFADNDSHWYFSRWEPLARNIQRRVLKGTFRPGLFVETFQTALLDAAKSYAVQCCSSPGEWRSLFPASVRREAARVMIAEIVESVEAGERF
jgi:hypothetical protein